jgi:hypothetical protein
MTALLTGATHDLTIRLTDELKRQDAERQNRQWVRQLAEAGSLLARLTLTSWDWVCETLEREGFEGGELRRQCAVVLAGMDACLAAYESVTAQAKTSGLSVQDAGLRELAEKLPALQEARSKVLAVQAVAGLPPRPVDETRLAASQAALERGELLSGDELLSRL